MKAKKTVIRLCSAMLLLLLICSTATPASAAKPPVIPPLNPEDSCYSLVITELPDEVAYLGSATYTHTNGTTTYFNIPSNYVKTWRTSDPTFFGDRLEDHPILADWVDEERIVESVSFVAAEHQCFISEGLQSGRYSVYIGCETVSFVTAEFTDTTHTTRLWQVTVDFAPLRDSEYLIIRLLDEN